VYGGAYEWHKSIDNLVYVAAMMLFIRGKEPIDPINSHGRCSQLVDKITHRGNEEPHIESMNARIQRAERCSVYCVCMYCVCVCVCVCLYVCVCVCMNGHEDYAQDVHMYGRPYYIMSSHFIYLMVHLFEFEIFLSVLE